MRHPQKLAIVLLAPIAMALLMILPGCSEGYYGDGPEWDGAVFFGGHNGGHDREYHAQAFSTYGDHRSGDFGSIRGRTSLGGSAGSSGTHSGGGVSHSGGGGAHSAGGGGHSGGGGGGGGSHGGGGHK
jgi:hypothetical protein